MLSCSPEKVPIPLKENNLLPSTYSNQAIKLGYKFFSCSTQLSMKFSPRLINMKMPTRVGIFIFISREMFVLSNV